MPCTRARGADLLVAPDKFQDRGDCCITGPVARSAALIALARRLANRLRLLGMRTVHLAGGPFWPIAVPGALAGRSRRLSDRIGLTDDRLRQPIECSGDLNECPGRSMKCSGRLIELPRQPTEFSR